MTDQANEQAAPAAAAIHDGEGILATTDRNSVLVEMPQKKAEPTPAENDERKWQLLSDKLGNELGQARKELKELKAQLENSTFQVPGVPEPVSYQDNPEAFIQQSITNALQEHLGPKLQMLESDLLQRKSTAFDERLSQVYPDWKESVKTDDFANWVKASPARSQMYQIADSNYDVDSAVELLKRFKQDQAEAAATKDGAIKAAGMVEGSGDSGGARVYAASEIRKLIESDPQEYQRWMSTEGLRAYQEGRVDQNR